MVCKYPPRRPSRRKINVQGQSIGGRSCPT